MNICIVLEWIGLFLGVGGLLLSGIENIFRMYFWINRFDRENGIVQMNANSWINRARRVSAVTWLAGTVSCDKFHKIIRWLLGKDAMSSKYLELSSKVLISCHRQSLFFFSGVIAFLIGCIILKTIE